MTDKLIVPRAFNSGDTRVNENPHLAALHAVFTKLHNVIASQLEEANFHWEDSKLFEEARRINNAIYAHIIYNEYVPALIGKQMSQAYNLLPLENGFFDGYEEGLDPRLTNEFIAAAFRHGHSLVNGDIP